ncbi:MAG: pyridine nucleotide-disulfide oxidoreductase [Rhizobiaceae bacterium]|nr:pyridine nucleotide-disulfide oxidoreductase [Rhizobiaceae bacterium]
MKQGVVIVGGGQAAASAAAKLRELDGDVKITLICGEPVLPYQRPPLSKKYLSGEMPLDRLILRPQDWFDQQNINVQCDQFVTSLDRDNKQAVLADGVRIGYDKLLLTTGSKARLLPDASGANAQGVHYLRAAIHADNMRPILQAGRKLVVIGGGYIGLEVSAVAAQMGMDVTVVELADRILQRVAAPQTSDFFRQLHTANGVRILESTGLDKIVSENGRSTGVAVAGGDVIDADMVLVGIGVLPQTELAEASGLTVENGILVDTLCRTSDPDIYAAGDCTSFSYNGANIRLESVSNAIHQAEIAAQNILGNDLNYIATPWFWSDQYDVKLQIAGLNMGYDHTLVRPGKREGSQSVWYYRGDTLLAVDAMNDAPSFMMARRILEAGKSVPKSAAADGQTNLKDWI